MATHLQRAVLGVLMGGPCQRAKLLVALAKAGGSTDNSAVSCLLTNMGDWLMTPSRRRPSKIAKCCGLNYFDHYWRKRDRPKRCEKCGKRLNLKWKLSRKPRFTGHGWITRCDLGKPGWRYEYTITKRGVEEFRAGSIEDLIATLWELFRQERYEIIEQVSIGPKLLASHSEWAEVGSGFDTFTKIVKRLLKAERQKARSNHG